MQLPPRPGSLAVQPMGAGALSGEILYRGGDREGGVAELRKATAAEDALRYGESKRVHTDFHTVWKDADVQIRSACFCQQGV